MRVLVPHRAVLVAAAVRLLPVPGERVRVPVVDLKPRAANLALVSRSFTARIARFLLAVLAASFLSPEFGWAMHADHGALAHHAADAPVAADHHHPGHDHSGDDSTHDHRDPHGSLGHVLGHLPATLSFASLWRGETLAATPLVQPEALRPSATPPRLDRPPRPAPFG